jgi:hypothetical protein
MHDVRAQVVQWIARNPDAVFDYPEIFSSEPPEGGSDASAAEKQMQLKDVVPIYASGCSLQEYCDKMSGQYEWGDMITLWAATRVFRIALCVISSTESSDDSHQRMLIDPTKAGDSRICSIGHILERHYVSLIG